ncbi:MAG: ketoacyl-ACP synthase III [Cyclobacteriaceae bacterium]
MYISHSGFYYPTTKIPNEYFEELNGLSNDWIVERTGIQERRKAAAGENTNTMAVEAVKILQKNSGSDLNDVDLIVGGTYSPYDTVVTLAHIVQNHLGLGDVPAVSVSSACSTFLNSMEIVEGYFASKKASKAILVLSEHNTAYNNEKDEKAGHLWGDGSVAFLVTKERQADNDVKIVEIITRGAANVGKGIEGVQLKPTNGGIQMPHGKDVFINAIQYMSNVTKDILERNNHTIADLNYLVPHQANLRITKNVAQNLGLEEKNALSNIQYLGNTGCAGSGIALAEHWNEFKADDVIVVTVFGGGYSYGAMLLEK